jgi:hypothetical protein
MGLFGSKDKFDGQTLAQLQSAPPPTWAIRVQDGRIQMENSGVIPYLLRSKSYFGPNLESWFTALVARTLEPSGGGAAGYPFLLETYGGLLSGLAEIMALGWDVWQDDGQAKSRVLGNDPFAGDIWNLYSVNFLFGALAFLKKAAEQHNRLLAAAAITAAPWETAIFDYKFTFENVSRGILVRTRPLVTTSASPGTLRREIARLNGGSA